MGEGVPKRQFVLPIDKKGRGAVEHPDFCGLFFLCHKVQRQEQQQLAGDNMQEDGS